MKIHVRSLFLFMILFGLVFSNSQLTLGSVARVDEVVLGEDSLDVFDALAFEQAGDLDCQPTRIVAASAGDKLAVNLRCPGGLTKVLIEDVATGESQEILGDSFYIALEWFPDGKNLLLKDVARDLLVIASGHHVIGYLDTPNTYYNVYTASLTHDGRGLVYATGEGMWHFDLVTKQTGQLADREPYGVSLIDASSTQGWLATVSMRGDLGLGILDIWSPTMGQGKRSFDEGYYRALRWSRDKGLLAVAVQSTVAAGTVIELIDAQTGAVQVVDGLLFNQVTSIEWWDDDDYLIIGATSLEQLEVGKTSMWLLDLRNGSTQAIEFGEFRDQYQSKLREDREAGRGTPGREDFLQYLPILDSPPLEADPSAVHAAPQFWVPFDSGQDWTVTCAYGCNLHTGPDQYAIDFARGCGDTCGKNIRAAAGSTSGGKAKVIMASLDGPYGNAVKLDHGGGYVSRYAHMQSISVTNGTEVCLGQVIGRVGNTGNTHSDTCSNCRGGHLHFVTYLNGSSNKPEPLRGAADYTGIAKDQRLTSSLQQDCTTPPPSGQVKLFRLADYSQEFWSRGIGRHNNIAPESYSMQVPSGWSVKTWRTNDWGGDQRCWSESVRNLQDHGWQNAIRSVEVFNYNACPPPPPSGQVKLWSHAVWEGNVVWSGGTGFSNGPAANSYSLEMPAGWSVKTWRQDNKGGEERCWSGSVRNLQDHGWHLAIQSIEVFDRNVCPPPPPSAPAKLWSHVGWEGNEVWSGGVGFSNGPAANSYSLQLPSGWSAITWRQDNKGGEGRCWFESVRNLQDYGWQLAIQSIEVIDRNVCPPTVPAMQSPVHAASFVQGTAITLRWSHAANASEYAAEYWGPTGHHHSGRRTSTEWSIGQLPIGTYQWHVEAYNQSGSPHWSGWSPTWTFTIRAANTSTPTPTVRPNTPTPTPTARPNTSTPTPTVRPNTPTPTPTARPNTSTPTPTARPNTLTPTPTIRPSTATPTPTRSAPTHTPTRPPVPWSWSTEAERPTARVGMNIAYDVHASGCEYVHTISPWSNHHVSYQFTVTQAGHYTVWARAMGLAWNQNSFFVSVDNGPEIHFEIEPVGGTYGSWEWNWLRLDSSNGASFVLSPGNHTIRFGAREANARLDRLIVTNLSSFEPNNSDVASCQPAATMTPTPTRTPTHTPTPSQNRPPNEPTNLFPANGSTHTHIPELCWQNNGDPDGDAVEFWVDVWMHAHQQGEQSGWIRQSCWRPRTLIPIPGTYYWHVGVKDSNHHGAPSPDWSFALVATATPTATRIPTATSTATVQGPGLGWRGEYFANRDLAGSPALVRYDTNIDFDWGEGPPAPGLPADNFSVRWTQRIGFQGGRYRFTVARDDGARLFIDGNLVFNEWRWGREIHTFERELSSGEHELRFEVFEIGGWAMAKLSWQRINDTTPPTGDFTEPAREAHVTSPIWLRAQVQDNPGGSGIAHVKFTSNGTGAWREIFTDTTPPYEVLWDMAGVPGGHRFMIGMEIHDRAGNRTDVVRWISRRASSDTIPPTGDFTEPAREAEVTAPVWLRAQAQDNPGGSGIARVKFTSNGTGTWREIVSDNSAPYEVQWDMAGIPDGRRFMIGIEIHDNAGNRTDVVRWITKRGSAMSVEPDSYEPDDTAGAARWVSIDGYPGWHNFHTAGDVDWVRFVSRPGQVTIETFELGSRADTVLFLYAPDGRTQLASNDNGGWGLASKITYTFSGSSTYFVAVRPYGSSNTGANSHYRLQIRSGVAAGNSDGTDFENTEEK